VVAIVVGILRGLAAKMAGLRVGFKPRFRDGDRAPLHHAPIFAGGVEVHRELG
jgi:hypothetical protein